MKGDVATHLNHSVAVADSIYNIANKDRASFIAAEFLENAYSGNIKAHSAIAGKFLNFKEH